MLACYSQDGVAYATKHLAPDVLLDMATLTGRLLVGQDVVLLTY